MATASSSHFQIRPRTLYGRDNPGEGRAAPAGSSSRTDLEDLLVTTGSRRLPPREPVGRSHEQQTEATRSHTSQRPVRQQEGQTEMGPAAQETS